MFRLHRQLAVFLLSLCCLTAQSVSVVAAPCGMNDHGSSDVLTEHSAAMPAMEDHTHHASAPADDTAAASDCCDDQKSCSMMFCYSAAAMLNSDFSANKPKATSVHHVAHVSNVRYAPTSFFKPPISL